MGKVTIKFHFLMGLPGSGKTYWRLHSADVFDWVIDTDSFPSDKFHLKFVKSLENCAKRLFEKTICLHKRILEDGNDINYSVCIDGLVTTKKTITEMVKLSLDIFQKKFFENCDFDIEIHQWKEDRLTCLSNDRARVAAKERETSSEFSINNLQYDCVFSSDFKDVIIDNTCLSVTRHEVVPVNKFDVCLKKAENFAKKGFITSDKWAEGGYWCDCWGGKFDINPDSPVEFHKLDKLLEEICPTLTFLQYKEIFKECVTIEKENVTDYYGGSASYNYYVCDINKLQEKLKTMNYL